MQFSWHYTADVNFAAGAARRYELHAAAFHVSSALSRPSLVNAVRCLPPGLARAPRLQGIVCPPPTVGSLCPFWLGEGCCSPVSSACWRAFVFQLRCSSPAPVSQFFVALEPCRLLPFMTVVNYLLRKPHAFPECAAEAFPFRSRGSSRCGTVHILRSHSETSSHFGWVESLSPWCGEHFEVAKS